MLYMYMSVKNMLLVDGEYYISIFYSNTWVYLERQLDVGLEDPVPGILQRLVCAGENPITNQLEGDLGPAGADK